MTLAELIVAALDEYDEARPNSPMANRVSVVNEVLMVRGVKADGQVE